MKAWLGGILLFALSTLGVMYPEPATGMRQAGTWCYSWATFGSWNGITLTYNMQQQCFYSSGGGYGGGDPSPDPPSSGGVPARNLFDGKYEIHQISQKLSCALTEYTHPAAPKIGAIRTVDAWAYGKPGPNGWTYKFNGNHVSTDDYGQAWKEVGGYATASGSLPWTYLFNAAYQAAANVHRLGLGRQGRPDNSLDGSLTSFEQQVYAAAHEMAHQNGVTNEQEANWFGIHAVKEYRADDGAKCPG